MFKGSPLPREKVTPEMDALVVKILNDPHESWWGSLHAVEARGRTTPELITQNKDRLLELMEYDCTWIQTAAVCTLAKICTQPQHQGFGRCHEGCRSGGEGLRRPAAEGNVRCDAG